MRAPTLSACLLLLTPSAILAAPSPSDVLLRIEPLGVNCPVGFSVERRSATEVVNVGQAPRHRASQRIRLTFSPFDTLGVARVDLVVHAASPNLQLLPAVAPTEPQPDIDRSFQLGADGTSSLHQRDLWVDGVGSIQSVDLRSITYANGATWHPSANSTCRAVPNGLTLVSAP